MGKETEEGQEGESRWGREKGRGKGEEGKERKGAEGGGGGGKEDGMEGGWAREAAAWPRWLHY